MTKIIDYKNNFEEDYLKVHNTSFADSCYSEIGWNQRLNKIKRDIDKIFLAIIGNKIIGEITLSSIDYGDDEICIDSISVLPSHRRKGVASLLLKKAEEYARSKNCSLVCEIIDSCDFLLDFYQKRGFKVKFLRYRVETDEKTYPFISMKEAKRIKSCKRFLTWVILKKEMVK